MCIWGESTGARPLLLLLCLLVVGCGSETVTSRAPVRHAGAPNLTAVQRCADAARLRSDVPLPAWHMGAVRFFSATSGVGITAETFPCFRPVNGGAEVGFQRQPVTLAVTSNGGRSWQVTGARIAVGPVRDGVLAEQIAALSPADVFAVIGTGRLMAAHDGGSDWQAQTVPSPVAQLTSADGSVWAMSCPSDRGPPTSFGCRPQLWRTRSAAAAWTRVPFPPVRAQGPFDLRLAVATGTIAVVLPAAGNAAAVELLTSRAAGLRWTGRRAPTGDHNKCNIPAALTSNRAGVATTTRTRGSPAETPAPTSPHTASDRRGVRSSISCGRDPQCGFVSAEPTRPTAETRVLVIAEGSEDPLTALRAAGSRLPYWTRLAFPQASAAGDAQRLLPSGLSRAAIRSWRVGQGPPSSLTPRGRPQVIMSRRGSAAPPTRGQARIGAEAA